MGKILDIPEDLPENCSLECDRIVRLEVGEEKVVLSGPLSRLTMTLMLNRGRPISAVELAGAIGGVGVPFTSRQVIRQDAVGGWLDKLMLVMREHGIALYIDDSNIRAGYVLTGFGTATSVVSFAQLPVPEQPPPRPVLPLPERPVYRHHSEVPWTHRCQIDWEPPNRHSGDPHERRSR